MDKKALYVVEVFKAGDYGNKLVFIVEAHERYEAMKKVRAGQCFGDRNANAARQVSARKAASLITEGAIDLRVQ